MKSAIMKITALSVVLGLGVLVVLQANRPAGEGSPSAVGDTTEEIQPAGKPGDAEESAAPQALVSRVSGKETLGDALDEDTADVVPADRKLAPAVRPQPRRPAASSSSASKPSKSARQEEELESRLDRLLDEEDPDLPSETPDSESVAGRGHSSAKRIMADESEETGTEVSTRSAPGRPARPRPAAASRRQADSREDEEENEPATASSRRSSGGRSRVVSGGLSLPDEPEADEPAANRSAAPGRSNKGPRGTGSTRRNSAVIPAGQLEESDDAIASPEEETPNTDEGASPLGSDLEDPDEEFQPRGNASRSSPASARTQFAGENETAEPTEEPAEEAESAPAVSRRPRAAAASVDGGFEGVDEPGLVPSPRSPAESRLMADDEPNGDEPAGAVDDEESGPAGPLSEDEPLVATEESSPPETSAAQPRSQMTDEDEEDVPVRPQPEQPRGAPPRKTPTASSNGEDDDPLQIRPGRVSGGSGAGSEPKQESFRRDDEGNSGEDPQPVRKARPRLTIDKKAPETAVLGRPMIYEIVVKNSGLVAARGVVVEDVVPAGIRIEGSKPQAQLEGRRLSWRLGTLEAGATQTIAVRVTPESEGTLSGVATVHFDNEQSGDSRTGPRLQVSVDAPRRITVGQTVSVTFKVRNLGKTNASGVLIHDVLPAALKHPAGDDLEYEIGDIPPGESREVTLQLTAAQSGQAINRAVITADGAVTEETVVVLEVVGPVVNVTRTGVKRLLPGRRGRFTNVVTNPTATPLGNVMLVETIPAGMDFLDATDGGTYDDRKRTVTWVLGPMDPRESKSVSISLSANGRGSLISVVRASDPSGASGEAVSTTQVVGQPALSIEVPDLPGAVDVGQEVTAVVKVYNRGTDAATNARVTVSLPGTLEVVSVDGPVKYQRSASTVGGRPRTELRFDPVRSIDVKKYGEFKLKLRARNAGSGRLKVQAACDQIADPIQREDDLSVLAE